MSCTPLCVVGQWQVIGTCTWEENIPNLTTFSRMRHCGTPSLQHASLPSAPSGIQYLDSKCLSRFNRKATTSCKSQALLRCVSLSLQAAVSPHPTSLHLFKPFVEVSDGIFNSPWSTLFSLSCLLTSFYLSPALGIKICPPGMFPFHLYIKLCLSQSSSITLLLKSPG